MKSKLYLIIRREYLERVCRKSFIITTLLMPLLMVGLMVAPSLIMIFSGPENKSIAVIDNSGVIAQSLKSDGELKFVDVDPGITVDSVRQMTDYDAILVIGRNVVDNPKNVQMYTRSAPSMQTEQYIVNQIEDAIEDIRLKSYSIDNLAQIMQEVQADVSLSTYRLDKDSEAEATSSLVSYILGLVMMMILYMFILLYGQMVMNSIIEEKNNRVLEIVVSSVKPQVLMLGKILGIGCVAVTQILIWGILVGSFSQWIMPLIVNSVDGGQNVDLAAAVGQFTNTGYVVMLFVYITLFLIGGYMFYSSIFAAIGSAVDNIQDASQLTSLAMVPIMIAMIFSMTVATDPTSSLATWLSIIPFTSPMVMVTRIPFGIPSWEIWVSLAVLFVSFVFMVWLSAKIYRVGIFMYGKKPSIKDLIRWAKYK